VCFRIHRRKQTNFAQNNPSKTTDNKTKLLLKKTPKVEVAPKSIHHSRLVFFASIERTQLTWRWLASVEIILMQQNLVGWLQS
jgi:hypothetical protein